MILTTASTVDLILLPSVATFETIAGRNERIACDKRGAQEKKDDCDEAWGAAGLAEASLLANSHDIEQRLFAMNATE